MSARAAIILRSLLLAALCITAGQCFRTSPSGAFSQWTKEQYAAPDATLLLHLGLRHSPQAADSMYKAAWDIANPSSSNFRKHLSSSQLHSLAQPEANSVLAVQQWLHDNGIISTLRGDFIEAVAPVASVEKLLNTSYNIYSDGTYQIVRTESFDLPDSIADFLDVLTPTTHFPRSPSVKQHFATGLSSTVPAQSQQLLDRNIDPCASLVTPACITKVYDIDYSAKPNRTTFAVYGTEAAFFRPADLHTFLERYNAPAATANAQFVEVGSGDPADGTPGIGPVFETALDTQTSLGTAWPAKGLFYNNGGVFGPSPGQTYDNFVAFLQDLIHNETVPSVVSFSESMAEDMMDPTYARRLCDMMAQVGMRGVTLLFSSGDNGPNGDQPSGKHEAIFEPEFPASCPFVTAVGGTTNANNETAATASTMNGGGEGYYASGGGFSNLFLRPSYQDTVVPVYISSHVPSHYATQSGFNASGRGIPDVSALSTSLPTVVLGFTIPVGGTSASTPLWAAIVTLLNDYEASRGRPQLGFINPWLYSNASAGLKDIVTGGDSAGACELLLGCTLPKTLGYNVTAGWDAVTGLGTPKFNALLEILG